MARNQEPQSDEMLVAAVVTSARGLRGEVSAEVRTDRADDVFQPGVSFATSSKQFPRLTITSARAHSGRLLLQFAGVTTREEAEVLRGTELLVEPVEEEDAWHSSDLIGLQARDAAGAVLGTVSGLRPAPAHDLLLVRTEEEEVMVPFVREIVTEVNVGEGVVVVDAPAGLFPERG